MRAAGCPIRSSIDVDQRAAALAPWPRLEEGMRDVLDRAGGRPGHIFNLGHGVLPDTDPEQLARLAQAVHATTARRAPAGATP